MGLNPFDPSVINAAYRGVQPGAAPMFGSSNLNNAIPLTKFTYSADFKNIFDPAPTKTPQTTTGLPAGMSAEDYAIFKDPNIPESVKSRLADKLSLGALIPPRQTLDEKKAEWAAQKEFMTGLENERGDRTQRYATQNLIAKSILDSIGNIGRGLGSRYGLDPNSVGEAYQRMAGLSVRQAPMAPLPDVPAVRYYNV